MTILENHDHEMMQLWNLILELSDQLNQNRHLSVSLHAQVGDAKAQAVHNKTGFVLRRFNLDKNPEVYNEELQKMNMSIYEENTGLQHDNKHLNNLIKDYEQTLDTLMSNFRNRARDVQERELSLIREYEGRLLMLEESNASRDLATSATISHAISRLSRILRQALRAHGGEDVDLDDEDADGEEVNKATEHALEREIELARLEQENQELRRMLGLLPPVPKEDQRGREDPRSFFDPMRIQRTGSAIPPAAMHQQLSGPFGTFKRARPLG
ncbi:hypothetical protein CYLTODRAFT_418594 [Cylindrobasidium torrendii FP15055 ss-10]|uniref:Uncharacterized protein n=1 Tax=Cylindrobasidium torrendii FP15055 ss-10 TaxID=1314674 RepID=A0A0D7BNE5_9AGAR|nr:hypothetical protein CYLTODRAFT_418594 [Cylindrobasidium torrendii FP15055 ss-10]